MQNLNVAQADVSRDTPSHTPGIRQGNAPRQKKQPGLFADGRSGAKRSTGINAKDRDPIDSKSPNLSPA
jgi:hypothetical protein